MAETTLRDISKQLKSNQSELASDIEKQTVVLNMIKSRFDQFFDILEKQRLEEAERNREKKRQRDKPEPKGKSDTGTDWSKILPFAALGVLLEKLALGLTTAVGALASLALAAEGLGPRFSDLDKFIKKITAPQRKVTDTVLRPFRRPQLDPDQAGPPRKTIADEFRERLTKFKNYALRLLGIGEDGKPVQSRGPKGQFGPMSNLGKTLLKAEANLKNAFAPVVKTLEIAIKPFTGIAKLLGTIPKGAIKTFKMASENKWLQAFFKFLRPLAVVLSVFDGIGNAQKEMEDREGFFNKYLGGGIGGFVSGSLGSFFGEFINFLKEAPLFLIKKIFPDMVDEKGNFKREGMLGNALANLDEMDFNKIIRDLVQAPFDALGRVTDNIVNLFSEKPEDKEKAKKYFDEMFSTRGLVDLFDLVFSPLNAVIGIVMDLFKSPGEKSNTETKLSDKISQLFEGIASLIPSFDDIVKMIRKVPGGNALLNAFGIVETQAEAIERTQEALKKVQDQVQAKQAMLTSLTDDIDLLEEGPDSRENRRNINSLGRAFRRESTQLDRLLSDLEKARTEATNAQNPALFNNTNVNVNQNSNTQAAVIPGAEFVPSMGYGGGVLQFTS